jgi:drug/metabolite transporter (DMT)-like permease
MTKHYLVLAIGVVAVSFGAIFTRLAEAPFLVIAVYRLTLASLVISPIACIYSGKELRSLSRNSILMSLVAGFFLALHFVFWIASLSYTTVASSVVLVTSHPIFVALASYFLFHEKLRRNTILGIGICLIGAVLIGYSDCQIGLEAFAGDLLALLGALAIATYFLIGRKLRPSTGLLSYTFLVYGSAALFLLVATLVSGYSLSGYSTNTYVMLILLALIPQLLGHSTLNWSLRFMPATLVAIAILGEPVGATILASLFLDEIPTLIQLVGGIFILSGIFVAFGKDNIEIRSR